MSENSDPNIDKWSQTRLSDNDNEDKVLRNNLWMVRPCEEYKDEYNACKDIRGKVHYNYVHGGKPDCTPWKTDLKACQQFLKKNDLKYIAPVVRNEMQRFEARIKAAQGNNVWTYRTGPPPGWNTPLPEDMPRCEFGDDLKLES